MTEFFKFTYYLLRFMIVHRQAIRMRRQIGRSGVFDAAYYVNHVPSKDQSTAKIWPIMHYLVIGEPRGYLPNPLFITDYYRNQLLRHQISEMPLWHFVNEGFNSWFRPNPQFDCRYYAAPDIILNKVNPLAHYYLHGWKENRDPSRTFSSKDYLNHHPELIITGENPLAHFLRRELSEPTELWGLPPGASLDSLKSQPELPVRARFTVELIVPVYRRPECVEDLFDSMLDSADWADVERCTVVDDCGDSFTSDYLKKLPLRDPKIVIQKNQTNLGFLRSCNQAFSQARADIVVLVNSDVRVPGNWLRRLCAPLELDQLVALSTPLATSGANLSFALRPGQSWRDVDGILNSKPATYPDACTAIGYLMAIRRSAVGTSPLFDEMYKHGYCEDTDLHYRFISNGLRSVICDNLGIYHQGGASYELDEKKAAIYEANRKIFFARWETLHQVEHARYVNASPLQSRLTAHGHTVEEMEAAVLDVLLVAPTNNTAIGGVKIIFQLAEYLIERGLKVKVFCQEDTGPLLVHAHGLLMPVFKEDTLVRTVASAKIIVGTGAGVEKLTVQFAKMLQGQVWWLLQGPECYFGAGDLYFKFKKMLQSSQHVIAVSKYLYSLSISLGQRHVEWVSLGPNPLIFYPRDVRRQPHSIAIQLIDTPDKGARFALSFAEQAKHEGFEVHFFGGGGLASVVPSDLGRKHGRLDAEGLAKLFSQCSHYLDLSFMEGLGLLPLEAAFCGCRPVMTRKGAPEEIFSDRNATFLDSHLDIEGGWMRIKSSEALKSDDLNELRSSYSTKNAFDQVLVSLRKALS